MALVQPLTGEITDQLNLLIVGETHDDLLIQRIKRSIEKIRPHDIQQYHMLSGMLYSILGDVESCIDSHEKSLRYSSDVMFLHNYAYSMKRLGLSEKAYELMARSFDSSPTSECFGEYLTATIFAGIFDSFEERLVKFAKSNPETSVDDIGDVRYINHVRQILEGAGVSEVSYRKALELADSVIASKRYMTESIFIERGSFDGVPYVSVEMGINPRSFEDIVAINDGIADKLAGSDIDVWDKVVVSVFHDPKSQVA